MTVLIFHPNLRLCTKTLVLVLYCTIYFSGPPQGSQTDLAYVKADRETCRLYWGKCNRLFVKQRLKGHKYTVTNMWSFSSAWNK